MYRRTSEKVPCSPRIENPFKVKIEGSNPSRVAKLTSEQAVSGGSHLFGLE